MDSISPRQYLPITGQISDPLDTATYYLRAFIYRFIGSDAPELIDTVNLVDRGSQFFSYQWQTLADVSGEGYILSIIVKTYTDSDYTTESINYERTDYKYKIIERVQHLGGGVGVDYKRIKKMIDDRVMGSYPELSLDPVIKEIRGIRTQDNKDVKDTLDKLKKDISNIKLPKQDNSDLAKQIEAIKKQVENIKFPKQEKVDLKPIVNRINLLGLETDKKIKKIFRAIDEIPTTKEEKMDKKVRGIFNKKRRSIFK